MAAASILLSVAAGILLVYRFGTLEALRPRWAGLMLIVAGGIAAGIALTSTLYFILLPLGMPRASLFVRIAIVIGAAYECWRSRHRQPPLEHSPRFPYIPLLSLAFLVALAIVTYGMSTAWAATPSGNWDAWSIWNLRAKFLVAGGTVASRAWSPMLNFTHPEYPLLLSSFVASAWADAGQFSDAVPITTAYLFFLSLLGMVTGGIAVLRGPVSGLLAGLCLTGIPALLTEVPSQYADVPVACFIAGALLFALLDRPVLAGIMAGCAAWTKNEGLLFLAILFVAIAVVQRARLLRFLAGAAPAVAIVLLFKLVIARGTYSLVSGAQTSMASKLSDFGRYQTTASAMLHEIVSWGAGWYHPLLPIVILAIALRFEPRHLRDALFSATVAVTLLAGYFAFYVITPYELSWQLQSSVTRLFVQVAPLILISIFLAMRAPQPTTVSEPGKQRRKAKR